MKGFEAVGLTAAACSFTDALHSEVVHEEGPQKVLALDLGPQK